MFEKKGIIKINQSATCAGSWSVGSFLMSFLPKDYEDALAAERSVASLQTTYLNS
jgi:hypothetical protein